MINVSGGNRVVDSKVKKEVHNEVEIETGVVMGGKEKRDAKPLEDVFGGGGGTSPNTISGLEEEGDVVGNGVVIGSILKLKLRRDGAEKPRWGVGNGKAVRERSNMVMMNS